MVYWQWCLWVLQDQQLPGAGLQQCWGLLWGRLVAEPAGWGHLSAQTGTGQPRAPGQPELNLGCGKASVAVPLPGVPAGGSGQGRSVLGPHHVSLWAGMGRCFNCLYRLDYWRNKINSYSENADSIILPWFSVSWLVLLCLNEIYTCRHRYNPALFSTALSVIKLWIDLHHDW